jgi:hypothetical protein
VDEGGQLRSRENTNHRGLKFRAVRRDAARSPAGWRFEVAPGVPVPRING